MRAIIKEKGQKIKQKLGKKSEKIINFLRNDLTFFIILLFFVSTASFLLGKFSVLENSSLDKEVKAEEITLIRDNNEETDLELVASKNGRVYHLPWCSGAIRIKEENKIYFKNKEEAEKAGYRPSKSCEGL